MGIVIALAIVVLIIFLATRGTSAANGRRKTATPEGRADVDHNAALDDNEPPAAEAPRQSSPITPEAPENVIEAIREGTDEQVRRLIQETNIEINACGPTGMTLLCYAAATGKSKLVEWMIERGAHVAEGNLKKQTPLHLAAAHGKLETVRKLLDLGAPVNARDDQGYTPIDVAEVAHQPEIMGLLLSTKTKGGGEGEAQTEPPDEIRSLTKAAPALAQFPLSPTPHGRPVVQGFFMYWLGKAPESRVALAVAAEVPSWFRDFDFPSKRALSGEFDVKEFRRWSNVIEAEHGRLAALTFIVAKAHGDAMTSVPTKHVSEISYSVLGTQVLERDLSRQHGVSRSALAGRVVYWQMATQMGSAVVALVLDRVVDASKYPYDATVRLDVLLRAVDLAAAFPETRYPG